MTCLNGPALGAYLDMGREHAPLFEFQLARLLGQHARITAKAATAITKAASFNEITLAEFLAVPNLARV